MLPEIFTCFKRPDKAAYVEAGGGGTELQRSYVDQNTRIREMIAAGERLYAARAQQYEYDLATEDEDALMPDPTKRKGFDLVDAQRIAERTNQKYMAAKKAKDAADENLKNAQQLNKAAGDDKKGTGDKPV